MSLRAIDPASLFTYTQPDPTWHFNANGVLVEETTPDTLVLDHKYEGGAWVPRGQPLFPSGTSYMLHNRDLSNAAWLTNNVAVDADAATAPNGAIEADRLRSVSAGQTFTQVRQTTTIGAGDGCFWRFLKADTVTTIRLGVDSSGILGQFTLSGDGTASIVAGSGAASIAKVGDDGWYLCVLTATVIDSSQIAVRFPPGTSIGDAVFVWGGNFTDTEVPIPQIDTDGVPVARAGDELTIAGVLAQLFAEDEISIFVEWEAAGILSSSVLASNRVSSNTAGTELYGTTGGGDALARVERANAAAVSIQSSGHTPVVGEIGKAAVALKSGDSALSAYGQSAFTSTEEVGSVFQAGQGLRLMGYKATGDLLSTPGWIRRLTIAPRRIPNARLEALVA